MTTEMVVEFATKSGIFYQIDEDTLEWSTWFEDQGGKPVYSKHGPEHGRRLFSMPKDIEVGKKATILCVGYDNKAFVYLTGEIGLIRRYKRVIPNHIAKTVPVGLP